MEHEQHPQLPAVGQQGPAPAGERLQLWRPRTAGNRTDAQRLWCREAFAFLQKVCQDSDRITAFSLGPRLSQSLDLFAVSSTALLGPALASSSTFQFAFEREARPGALPGAADNPDREHDLVSHLAAVIAQDPRESLIVSQLVFSVL